MYLLMWCLLFSVACVTIGRGGYYPHRCSKSMYHQCQPTGDGWIAHQRHCAPGTVWSQWRVTCIHAREDSQAKPAPEEPQVKPDQEQEGSQPQSSEQFPEQQQLNQPETQPENSAAKTVADTESMPCIYILYQ